MSMAAEADAKDFHKTGGTGKMEMHPLEDFEDLAEDYASEVPEDVAILYSWANLQGAKYRDFSANRREHRAQMRQRAAEQLRLAELRAQSEAETAAKQSETEAAAAHAEADAAAAKLMAKRASQSHELGGHAWKDSLGNREHPVDQDEQVKHASLRAAAHQARKAAAEREEAARRAEAAALAQSMAGREQEEIADAQASALRQAARYAESGVRSRSLADADSGLTIPGRIEDPYSPRWSEEDEGFSGRGTQESHPVVEFDGDLRDTSWGTGPDLPLNLKPPAFPLTPKAPVTKLTSNEAASANSTPTHPTERTQAAKSPVEGDSRAEVVRHIPQISQQSAEPVAAVETPQPKTAAALVAPYEVAAHAMSELFEAAPVDHDTETSASPVNSVTAVEPVRTANVDSRAKRAAGSPGWNADVPGPAWLYPKHQSSAKHRAAAISDSAEPLEHSKERIAARWFALRGVFARHDADRSTERLAGKSESRHAAIVAVYSVAGGTGKTSLVATIGRALSFVGEKVLLSDTTSHGLLPFYFGASQLVSGVVRTFSPPAGSSDAPIHLVSYDMVRENEEPEEQAGILEDLLENSQRANRVLLDLSVNCSRMAARLSQFKPTILVPLMPDMNSVISIDAVEKLFSSMLDSDGRPLQPVYLLNQFDTSLPLHLDIREVLKQQLGDRLLPFVIRRSSAVGEALAEGMTVVDYEPGSPIAEDYMRVANWLRTVSAPVAVGFRNQRWSEQ
ncbi:cellulose synthase operon protein YhjQ [Granulicella aggregans]|uniref:Cellulose synthase operon protein YhjQ n=2 Tax=Granulicella aggregans TaxID=474949 RepID=A0A7W8E739_9BACT|nr:cellulose synthase operon protein YhjQ [Granulicella aggregans]